MAFVQAKNATADGSASTIAVTFDSNVVAGNLIYVIVHWYVAGAAEPTSTAADGLGNTYTKINSAYESNIQVESETFYAKNILVGACTVTVTLPAARAYRRITVVEYSGLDTTAPLDQQAVTASAAMVTGADGTVSASITPTVDGCTIVGGLVDAEGTTTIAPGTDFTERSDLTDQQVEDLVQGTAAAITAKWTVTNTHWCSKFVVSFKPATGGSGSGRNLLLMGVG